MVDTYGRKETFEALANLRRDDGGGVAEETVAELAAATRDAFARSSIDDEATMLEMIRQVKNQPARARRRRRRRRARGGEAARAEAEALEAEIAAEGEDGRGGARGGGGEGAGGDHPKRIPRISRCRECGRRITPHRRAETSRSASYTVCRRWMGRPRRRRAGRRSTTRGDEGAASLYSPDLRRVSALAADDCSIAERSSQTAPRASPRKTEFRATRLLTTARVRRRAKGASSSSRGGPSRVTSLESSVRVGV